MPLENLPILAPGATRMIDLDRLKLRAACLLCVALAIGWAVTLWHTRTLVSVTEIAQAGWGQCTSHALVKLDELEARRRANIEALVFRGPVAEIDP